MSRINHVESLKKKSDKSTNYDYEYDSTTEVGSGVDIYILGSLCSTRRCDSCSPKINFIYRWGYVFSDLLSSYFHNSDYIR